jgi:hypothetical protein
MSNAGVIFSKYTSPEQNPVKNANGSQPAASHGYQWFAVDLDLPTGQSHPYPETGLRGNTHC